MEKDVTIAIHADSQPVEEAYSDILEEDDLTHINLDDLVDMLDVNVVKELYKQIHIGSDELRMQ